ncbi:hypothetical protein Agub_g11524, partial [Astrephomene gubernaculifera]
LAAADVEAVNAMWAGLGYYRRARYLLEGARFVVEKLGGEFPTTAAELLKIPGVGPYTSAAVASIAFSRPSAAVDGNVVRVVSRLAALPGDPSRLAACHAALALELLDPGRPGCYNQAIMELGATVCRPVNPDCAACPVRRVCRAAAAWETYLAGGGDPDMEDAPRVTQYPGRKAVKQKREQAVAVTVLEVICTREHPQQQQQPRQQEGHSGQPAVNDGQVPAAAAAAGGADVGNNNGGGNSAVAPPRKRQRTMEDFALAAAARKQRQQQQQDTCAAGGAGPGGSRTPGGGCDDGGGAAAAAASGPVSSACAADVGVCGELEALLARGSACRRYLLTMRPQGGLLAGLWEFPGAVLQDVTPGDGGGGGDDEDAEAKGDGAAAAATTSGERRRASEELLCRLLGPAGLALTSSSSSSSSLPPASAPAAAPSAEAAPGCDTGAVSSNLASGVISSLQKDQAVQEAAAQRQQQGLSVLRVLGRHDMGTYVHVFSHIRQTNYVQRLTVVHDGDVASLERLTGAASPVGNGVAVEGGGQDSPPRFPGRLAVAADAAGAAGAGAAKDGTPGEDAGGEEGDDDVVLVEEVDMPAGNSKAAGATRSRKGGASSKEQAATAVVAAQAGQDK